MNFVTAVAYHFYLNLPAAFTKPGQSLLVVPCPYHSFVRALRLSEYKEQFDNHYVTILNIICAHALANTKPLGGRYGIFCGQPLNKRAMAL